MEQKIIMYDDPSIIRKVDMVDETGKVISVGYLSNDNFFYNNIDLARYQSCTHKTCECGKPMKKYYMKCDDCRTKLSNQRYSELPFEDWDEKTPVVTYDGNDYFFDIDDIIVFCEELEIEPNQLMLVICEPNKMKDVTSEYWEDIIPENMDNLPKEIEEALENFNKVIRNAEPLSWRPGKKRTTVTII